MCLWKTPFQLLTFLQAQLVLCVLWLSLLSGSRQDDRFHTAHLTQQQPTSLKTYLHRVRLTQKQPNLLPQASKSFICSFLFAGKWAGRSTVAAFWFKASIYTELLHPCDFIKNIHYFTHFHMDVILNKFIIIHATVQKFGFMRNFFF